MNDLFIYLGKVSAGLAIIFLPYYFLFRNDPNLLLKRFYLLAGVAASWIFPFITFRKLPMNVDLAPTVFIDLDAPATNPVFLTGAGSHTGLTINWLHVLVFIYLAGLTFMFLKTLFIVFKWNFTWLRNHDDRGVVYTENDQVFTLFTRIFIPGTLRDEQDLDNILLHEKAHIQQLHFIDLILMELTLLLTWFNPFSWLISRMIKENHEHMADRRVLAAGVNPARYKAQLMNHTLGVNVFRLGNQFNHSLTLKRFKMMKKPEKSMLGILKIALLIPVVLITLGLTTGMTPQQKTVKGKVVIADTGEPAVGASVVIRNSTVGTVVDRDGSYMINVDGDPELVISFVGYKTLSIKASDIGNKPLELEVETYTLDLESVPMALKQKTFGGVSIRTEDGTVVNPVYVLDGKVVTKIDDLDPDLIESVSVVKDPNDPQAKKYNAKEGLILITTKEAAASTGKNNEETFEKNGEVFYVVEDMPKFPGDLPAMKSYIYSNLEYPENAKNHGIEGSVIVRFMINNKGKVVHSEILRSTYQEFDAPALKVINGMPDWTPGKQRGKPVNVWYVISIKFPAPKT
jgi:TonB family protein